jgi:hypothetical protein
MPKFVQHGARQRQQSDGHRIAKFNLLDGDYNRIDYDNEPEVVDSGELASIPEAQDEPPEPSHDNQWRQEPQPYGTSAALPSG